MRKISIKNGLLSLAAEMLAFLLAFCLVMSCDKDDELVEPDDPNSGTVDPDDGGEEPDDDEPVEMTDDQKAYIVSRAGDMQYTLSGIDELGRTVAASKGDQSDKYVGMFYFLWLGYHTPVNQFDVNYLEESHPSSLWSAAGDSYSATGTYHFWGKPLYGYYSGNDEWVITRHVELFTAAGIDFLGIDVTNAYTYDANMKILLDVLLKFQKQGFNVPKVMFLTNTNPVATAAALYDRWYADGTYDSLWFAPNGKPMISCATSWDSSYDSIMSTFDVKFNQWPNASFNEDGFAWMEWSYPQPYHSGSRMISVSVAQHVAGWMSLQSSNWGRSYNFSSKVNDDDRVKEGLNYQSQWDTVLDNGRVQIAFITGWNEWQAIKFSSGSTVYFVDEFDTNYSRDVEMMDGGYGDCYYMQTVENARAFKSSGTSNSSIEQKTINIDGNISQWYDVKYVYRDFEGDAIARNHSGAIDGYSYSDTSNRNDIVTIKVANDDEYVYFYVETAENITKYSSGTEWMNILIGQAEEGGFAGYEYLINAAPSGDTTSVSKFTGDGFKYSNVGTAQLRVNDNVMLVQVALSDIGLSAADPSFIFKVSDNVTYQDDIMDYYVTGDSAPIGRLSYTYGY